MTAAAPPPLSVEARAVNPRIGRDIPAPSYATAGSAGLDLHACIDRPLPLAPGQMQIIPTGVAIHIGRDDYVGILAARSGLSVRHGIALANGIGVIDSDYQDEIRAALVNRGGDSYTIAPAERICQMLFLPVSRAALNFVKDFTRATPRGVGGFGSTGRF